MDYYYTQVNLTTLHLVQNERYYTDVDIGYFTDFEYATVYDSLLTMYDAIVLHHRNTGDCLWIGKDYITSTLARVGIPLGIVISGSAVSVVLLIYSY